MKTELKRQQWRTPFLLAVAALILYGLICLLFGPIHQEASLVIKVNHGRPVIWTAPQILGWFMALETHWLVIIFTLVFSWVMIVAQGFWSEVTIGKFKPSFLNLPGRIGFLSGLYLSAFILYCLYPRFGLGEPWLILILVMNGISLLAALSSSLTFKFDDPFYYRVGFMTFFACCFSFGFAFAALIGIFFNFALGLVTLFVTIGELIGLLVLGYLVQWLGQQKLIKKTISWAAGV